jgi:hypothetical protein
MLAGMLYLALLATNFGMVLAEHLAYTALTQELQQP